MVENGEGSMDRTRENRDSREIMVHVGMLACIEALDENGSRIKTDRKRYRCGKRYIAFAGARAATSLILEGEEGNEQEGCLHVRTFVQGSAHLCAFRFCLRVRIYSV